MNNGINLLKRPEANAPECAARDVTATMRNAMDRLDGSICILEAQMDTLVAVLYPILSPEDAEQKRGIEEGSPISRTERESAVNEFARRLNVVSAKLNKIMDRCHP